MRSAVQNNWVDELSLAVTDVAELARMLSLSEDAIFAAKNFPLRVPREFVSRMRKNDPGDPLLLQILPSAREQEVAENYTDDPLSESDASPLPGLLHKYYGRVLLLTTADCAVNCRFCFRRHVRDEVQDWGAVLAYIAADSTISEVILSGGEPLLLSDEWLAWLVEKLAAIPHVRRLRVHTRLPILLPNRVTDELIIALTKTRLVPILVLHCNCAAEIDESVRAALLKFRAANIVLFNQAVLLKNINDSVFALASLSEALWSAQVIPYYLHLLDKVAGSAHFHVPVEKAKILHAELAACLPGYLVPRLVCEQAGASAKILL